VHIRFSRIGNRTKKLITALEYTNSPASFAEESIEGGWIIDGREYATNPTRDLDPVFLEIVELWRACRPQPGVMRGMTAGFFPVPATLPEAGGALDQGAWLQHAFDLLDHAESARRSATIGGSGGV
jgi:hypothetical protein